MLIFVGQKIYLPLRFRYRYFEYEISKEGGAFKLHQNIFIFEDEKVEQRRPKPHFYLDSGEDMMNFCVDELIMLYPEVQEHDEDEDVELEFEYGDTLTRSHYVDYMNREGNREETIRQFRHMLSLLGKIYIRTD
jgi:hypothetical protein